MFNERQYKIDIEILEATVNDPRLPKRGQVPGFERVMIFHELLKEHAEEIIGTYNQMRRRFGISKTHDCCRM